MAFFDSRAEKSTTQPSLLSLSLLVVTVAVLLITQWRNLSAVGWINQARILEMRECTRPNGQIAQNLIPTYLERASKQSPNGLANEILGDYYFNRARYADAIAALRRSGLVRPWAGWQLGFAFYQLGQTDQALTAWRTPGSADWLFRYAQQVTDDHTAERFYLLALEVEPEHPQAGLELAIRYAVRARDAALEGNEPEARYWLSRALELPVGFDYIAYADLVSVTAFNIGEYQLALNAALAGARSFPNIDRIHWLAAKAAIKLGNYALAIDQYTHAIAVSERRKSVYQLQLADLYVNLDMISEAKALYRTVYESGDADSRAKAAAALSRLDTDQ